MVAELRFEHVLQIGEERSESIPRLPSEYPRRPEALLVK